MGIDYSFTDFRAEGLSTSKLKSWCDHLGWQTILNTRSTSWRQLDENDKENLTEQKAIKLMLANPTLIKRPVIECGSRITVGFNEDVKSKLA